MKYRTRTYYTDSVPCGLCARNVDCMRPQEPAQVVIRWHESSLGNCRLRARLSEPLIAYTSRRMRRNNSSSAQRASARLQFG